MNTVNLILTIIGILVSGFGLYYAIKQVKGWISEEKMQDLAKPMLKNQYGQYLLRVIEEKKGSIDSDTFRHLD